MKFVLILLFGLASVQPGFAQVSVLEGQVEEALNEFSTLSPGSGGPFEQDPQALASLQNQLHVYEVQKLQILMAYLNRVIDESEFRNLIDADLKLALSQYDEAQRFLQNILDQLSKLEMEAQYSSQQAKAWHGLIPKRNSAFRKLIREFIAVVDLGETANENSAWSRERLKVRLFQHAQNIRWLRYLAPHYRDIYQFLRAFFETPESDKFEASFTPAMHEFLQKFGDRKKMLVQYSGFSDDIRAKLKQEGLHVFIMNHRDIYLDPYFVSHVLKAADCSPSCYYAVDPVRYFGGMTPRISRQMIDRPDFLPVGTEPKAAIDRLKVAARNQARAQVFIFPEATTSLIGDTANLDPYFPLTFIRSLQRLDSKKEIFFHVVGTDAPVDLRFNFRQRISQYFQPRPPVTEIRYLAGFSASDLPRKLDAVSAYQLNAWIWSLFIGMQKTDETLLGGQLRASALRDSVISRLGNSSTCRNALLSLPL